MGLDFLGFLLPIRRFSMGYKQSKTKKFNSREGDGVQRPAASEHPRRRLRQWAPSPCMAQAGAPFSGRESSLSRDLRRQFRATHADCRPPIASRPPGESSASVHDPGAAAVARRFAPSWFPDGAGPAWTCADWPRANAVNAFSAMLCNFTPLRRFVALGPPPRRGIDRQHHNHNTVLHIRQEIVLVMFEEGLS